MKAIIDVHTWHTIVDMETGYPCRMDGSYETLLSNIAARYPYPGDQDVSGIHWVTKAAEEAVKLYDPQWLCLNYSNLAFNGVHRPMDIERREQGVREIIKNTKAFARNNGYRLILVGTGGLVPVLGNINIQKTVGIIQGSYWTKNIAGIYHAETNDLEIIRRIPHLKSVDLRFEKQHNQTTSKFMQDYPDIMLIGDEGWAFHGVCCGNQQAFNMTKAREFLPIYSEIGVPKHVEDVRRLMDEALDNGEKVLMVIAEALDETDFEATPVPNKHMWYCYENYSLYYTLVTGQPFYHYELGPVHDMTISESFPLQYPFSIHGAKICENSIGRRPGLRTACVGSRSMIPHAIINADLTIECFIRDQANMGVLVAVNEDKFTLDLGISTQLN